MAKWLPFSQKLSVVFREIARRINRQSFTKVSTDTKIHFQYNIHPSTPFNEELARKVFRDSQSQKIIFHCYWYGKFDRKQAMSIKSLLATQNDYSNEVWLWLDRDTMSENGEDNTYIQQISNKVKIMEFSAEMVKSIPAFRRVYFLFGGSENLANRADGFRFWALHEYGGCYFDLDVMFVRSMRDLFMGSEFVYSWEKQLYANSAIIFVRKGSYIAEYIVNKAAGIMSTLPWAVFTYDDPNLRYMRLCECSLFDPLWNAEKRTYIFSNFGDFLKRNPDVEAGKINNPGEMFPYSYAYHWHNQWNDEIETNSPFEFCEGKFNSALGIM